MQVWIAFQDDKPLFACEDISRTRMHLLKGHETVSLKEYGTRVIYPDGTEVKVLPATRVNSWLVMDGKQEVNVQPYDHEADAKAEARRICENKYGSAVEYFPGTFHARDHSGVTSICINYRETRYLLESEAIIELPLDRLY